MSKDRKPKRTRPNLRLDRTLHARLASAARRAGTPVNGLLTHLLLRVIGKFEVELVGYEAVGGENAHYQFKQLLMWLQEKPGRTPEKYFHALMKRHIKETVPSGVAPAWATKNNDDDPELQDQDEEEA